MPLDAVQLAARKGKLTASRVGCLMTGNPSEILRLYQELIGEAEPEDLTDVWPVQLGAATEELNLTWFERANQVEISRRGEVVPHPYLGWACCTLDGWANDLDCAVECKHVGGREPIEVVIARYQPQCQWIMEITCSEQIALSIIVGANPPLVEFLDRDEAYAKEMIARGDRFINYHVANRIPPVEIAPAPEPVVFEKLKPYDMTGDEQWARTGAIWLQTRGAFESCRDAEKLLKSLVPDDASKCSGAGIQITRNRAGNLSLRVQQ